MKDKTLVVSPGDLLVVFLYLGGALLLAACQGAAPRPGLRTVHEQLNAQHGGDYFKDLPFHLPDSCVQRIRRDIPVQFQANFCETLFYRLGDDIDPTIARQHLDVYDRSFPSDSLQAFTNMMRGVLYMNEGRFDSAQLLLTDSYKAHKRARRMVRAGDAQKFLAQTYIYQADYPNAIRLLLDTYELYRHLPDSSEADRKCGVPIDLAVTYGRSNDHKKALYWAQHLWKIVDTPRPWANNFKVQAADVLTGCYLRVEKADSALYYAHHCLAMREQLHVEYRRFLTLMYIAKAHFLKNNCQQALDTLLLSKQIYPGQDQPLMDTYNIGFGDCFLCLGQLDNARRYFESALLSADTSYLARAHEGLSKVYEKQRHYEKALRETRESNRLGKLVFNAEKSKAVGFLENRFEVMSREHQINELEKQHQINRQRNLILALVLLLSLVGALAIAFRLHVRQRLLKQEKALAEARELLHQQHLARTEAQLLAQQEELLQTSQLLKLKEQIITDLEMQLSAPTSVQYDTYSFPRMKILTPEDWLKFQHIFDQRMPGFSGRIKQHFPALTNAETRLLLLIKLKFESREIAEMQGISVESIWRNRNRLRKKLSVDEPVDLDRFIQDF